MRKDRGNRILWPVFVLCLVAMDKEERNFPLTKLTAEIVALAKATESDSIKKSNRNSRFSEKQRSD